MICVVWNTICCKTIRIVRLNRLKSIDPSFLDKVCRSFACNMYLFLDAPREREWKVKKKKKKKKKLHTDHNRRRVCIAGRHLRHDTRISHPHPSYPSDTQLIIDHGERIVRRSHLAGSRLMIFRRSVMTNRAFPVSVAAKLKMLAILHGSSIQLETVPEKNFITFTIYKKNIEILLHFSIIDKNKLLLEK